MANSIPLSIQHGCRGQTKPTRRRVSSKRVNCLSGLREAFAQGEILRKATAIVAASRGTITN